MSVLQANCPSCGGQVQFTAGSTIVVVCPYCRSAIARTDRGLEDIGKVAEIADSESPLKLGLKGTYKDAQKELTRLLSSADDGTLPDPTRMTVGEYLLAWLDTTHAQSPKTLERYRELAQRLAVADSRRTCVSSTGCDP